MPGSSVTHSHDLKRDTVLEAEDRRHWQFQAAKG